MGLEEQQNINISAYRVLYILSLLVQHHSLSLDEVNQYLLSNPLIGRAYNSETITKYMNTLRFLGCDIPRSSSRNQYRYELQKNPFAHVLSDDLIEIARRVAFDLERQPDEGLSQNYNAFLSKVAWMMGEASDYFETNVDEKTLENESIDTVIESKELQLRRDTFKKFQDFCQEELVLELLYRLSSDQVVLMNVEPNKVLVEETAMHLFALDCKHQKPVKLKLSNILTVAQLPTKSKKSMPQVTVVFQLYGRLAKSYRPYPEEDVVFKQEHTIQIRAKTAYYPQLMRRLLKYGDSCQIISPSYVRNECRARILYLKNMLEKNLNQSTSPEEKTSVSS